MAHETDHVIPVTTCLLIKDGKTFLLRRANSGWADGMFTPPAGHVEPGETPVTSALREIYEEAGVKVAAEDLKFIASEYRKADDGTANVYANFVFVAERWQGEPKNNEPAKCDLADWFDLGELPGNMKEFMKSTFENYKTGRIYEEFGPF